ncbi:MAG: acetate--CoA ligase family protein [Pigmentiphaga sp.]
MREPLRGASLARVLLYPASVAIVGASRDADETAGRPLSFLRASGFPGRVYPVNLKADAVQGERAWPTLSDLPEVPEHVFVLTPTDSVLPVVEECGRLGVEVVTVLAGGFADAGRKGVERELALRRLGERYGVRILGPSSLGVIHSATGLRLTANAAFAEPDLPAGRFLVASHSGSMIGALVSRGKAIGAGFAALVSVGGEVDLSVGEICAATLDDPTIDGYALFLESLRHGEELERFAIGAAQRNKPVIAYKLGRSEIGAAMAVTHTGALAGEDDVAEAFLKGCGIGRVSVFESLLEALPLAGRFHLGVGARPGRVGVIATTGGGAAMVVDQLSLRGCIVQDPTEDTLARLRNHGIASAGGPVLDLTLAGTRYEVMKRALDIMLEAPEFDLVVVIVGSSARFHPQLAVAPVLDSRCQGKPLAVMLVPDAPDAMASLVAADVPCFRTPESCADSIAAVFGRNPPMSSPRPRAPQPSLPARMLSEAASYAVLEEVGIPHAPFTLLSLSEDPRPLPFDYPVAVKVCSASIPHKTDVGGVVLNVRSDDELAQAVRRLAKDLTRRAPGHDCEDVLVQTMAAGLAEVLIGYRMDENAGPIVVLSAGGIWAEVVKDRSVRLAPVDLSGAYEMIDEVRVLKTLGGLRGAERGDLDALAQAIVALSQLPLLYEGRVAEAEINPLLVMARGSGVLAVDALVRLHMPS